MNLEACGASQALRRSVAKRNHAGWVLQGNSGAEWNIADGFSFPGSAECASVAQTSEQERPADDRQRDEEEVQDRKPEQQPHRGAKAHGQRFSPPEDLSHLAEPVEVASHRRIQVL